MSLAYNTETAVEQNNVISDKKEVLYNYKPVIYGASTTSTQTIREDFILTGIFSYATCCDVAGISSAQMQVTFLSETFPGTYVYGENTTGMVDSLFVPIPNWFIPAGTVLTFVFFGVPATGAAYIQLTGYNN